MQTRSLHPFDSLLRSVFFSRIPLRRGPCRAILSVAGLLALSSNSFGTTFYVAPTGSDGNPGTQASPFATLTKGVSVARAGDTVSVADGTYGPNGHYTCGTECSQNVYAAPVAFNASGTASAPITVAAQNKWGAILDCQLPSGYSGDGTDGVQACDTYFDFQGSASWITISGFDIQRAYWVGAMVNATNSHISFIGNHFHHIGNRIYSVPAGTSSYGIVGVYAGTGSSYITWTGNEFNNIGRLPHSGTILNDDYSHDHGLYIYNGPYTIANNIFHSQAAGWNIQTAPGSHDISILNNTMTGGANPQKDGCMMLWGQNTNLTVTNNIFYGGRNYAIDNYALSPSGVFIDHSIVYGSPSGIISAGGLNLTNNRLNTDPLFVSLAANDFHLQSGSPAIDTGAAAVTTDFDGNPRPLGAAVDVGAYEYTGAGGPPAAPRVLPALVVTTSEIDLTWTNNSPDATAMLVEMSTDNVNFTQIASLPGNATSYAATGLTAGTLYYFRVRAQNAAGTSAYSNTASATTSGGSAPAAPGALTAAAVSTTAINLAWTNNSTSATAVLVERSADNVTFAQIASLAGTATSYSSTGLTAGTHYYFRVRAQNAAGTSAYSNTANATTSGGSAPAAPTSLAAAAVSTTAINLAWTNNSTSATAVLVERSTDNVTFAQIASLAGSATSYANTGLTAGTLYYYRVRAQNAAGTSAYSNTASATTSGNAPAAPSALAATAVSTTAINLAWTSNSTSATAVLVERSTDNVTFAQIASLAGSATSYANTGLTAGTLYYYRVRAQNAAGTSAYSNTASATTSGNAPAAPSALAATAVSTTAINLAWTSNSTSATAVLVERSTDNVAFTQIASLAGTATSYSSTGLTAGTHYYYRVRAQNAAGTSAYSNTASATTNSGGSAPAAPGNVAAGQSSVSPRTQINVYWTDNSNNETGFAIFRSPDNVTFTQIATVGANVTEYDNAGLTPNTRYYYYVKAFNAAGTSAASNTDWTVTKR